MLSGHEDFRRRMLSNIERTGRTVINVMAEVPFSYTIGNSLKNLPEVLIIGLSGEDAMPIANALSRVMVERGREFADGELVSIGGRFPVKAVHCAPSVKGEYTIQAGQLLGHEDYRVTQVIVPDLDGRFPDDPGCEEPYCLVPVLGR